MNFETEAIHKTEEVARLTLPKSTGLTTRWGVSQGGIILELVRGGMA